MVSVSVETPEATEARLSAVIARCELTLWDVPFAFHEFAAADFPGAVRPDALAVVRDGASWSQLAPAGAAEDALTVWQFHFPPDLDNSGFVGWLATRLKARFGSGVIVICGQTSSRGGIHDYWGAPWPLRDVIRAELAALTGPFRPVSG